MSLTDSSHLDSTRDLERVPGWFPITDQLLFRAFLEHQARTDMHGNLAEFGAYLGKTAVLLGDYVRDGEELTVIDLFGADASDSENLAENAQSYPSVTLASFQQNYLRFHNDLPRICVTLTSNATDHIARKSLRFLHVDASHLYQHVAGDTDAARSLLQASGVVSYVDFRAMHTPGVAAAVWEAVLSKGLHPICITQQKFYGTWGDPVQYQQAVEGFARINAESVSLERQAIAGQNILRISTKSAHVSQRLLRRVKRLTWDRHRRLRSR